MNYRGYLITPYPQSPTLLKVATEGQGGKIPNVLLGLHTSHGQVKSLIDHYLDNLKDNENGKTTPKSRG